MNAVAWCRSGGHHVYACSEGKRAAPRGHRRSRRRGQTRVSETTCPRAASSSSATSSSAAATAVQQSLAEWVIDAGGDISAVRVDEGARGRGLFAARAISKGEAVLSVPIRRALNDGVARPPYPGAPWSVTLAAAILRERDLGAASPWAPYISSLPTETIGFANSPEAAAAAGMGTETAIDESSSSSSSSSLHGDAAAAAEMARYASLLRGAHEAMTMMRHAWSIAEWRWAMSQVHSRTFRVEEPAQGVANCLTRRLMVPFVDLLNHDSRDDVWQCEWGCEWVLGGGDGAFVVRAVRDVAVGEEVLISYGGRNDRHFFLFFGFLPEPNPHNTVALFSGLEQAAAWYEELCQDRGEEAARLWAAARSRAVAQVRSEERERAERERATERATPTEKSEDKNINKVGADEEIRAQTRRQTGADSREEQQQQVEEPQQEDQQEEQEEVHRGCVTGEQSEHWTSADAEAEEAAALNVGEGASVDARLLRLFQLLSGDADVAEAAVRVRAAQLLDELRRDRDESEDADDDVVEVSEAARLMSDYCARRKALLASIA